MDPLDLLPISFYFYVVQHPCIETKVEQAWPWALQ